MSKIYISKLANQVLINYLENKGHEIVLVGEREADIVYEAVSCHPDIYMCKLGCRADSKVYMGNKKLLGFNYPGNIRYNAAVIGKYFIHNLKYTDEILLSLAKDLIKVNVKQGYTKCNISIIDDNHCITSDCGIAKSLRKNTDIEVLLISPGQISLPGCNYGFIGGASGKVGNEMIFNGDLSAHENYKEISNFIEKCGLKVIYFKEYELTDIGSILEEAY